MKIKNKVKPKEMTVEKAVPEELLEYDIVVRMPPKKKYKVQIRIRNIRRGEPRIVDPEWIL